MEQIPAVSQEIEREDHVAIGMENINMASEDIKGKVDALTEIRGQLERLSPLSSECCIYRVPVEIHEVSPKSYTPKVVSIGPFHHGKRHLQAMEEHKLRYLQSFLNRIEGSLDDYFEVVKTWEEKARHCYAETIRLSSDEFVKMILVDGSFIIECLLRNKFAHLVDESDLLFGKPWMLLGNVCDDMILLENQLPFFVLEGLFNLLSIAIQDNIPSFLELVNGWFIYWQFIINKLSNRIFDPPIQHFVDFIRYSYLQSLPEAGYEDERTGCFPPSLSQLHEAGIKFETKTSCSLFDIKFTNGILEIPTLIMYGSSTETLFRNLIAFEECHCEDMYIFDYMKLFQSMIKTTKDADLLIQHRILTGRLRSTEFTLRMFEKICSNVYSKTTFYFTSLSENLHAYCETPSNKWKASLKRDYLNTIFNTPWKILSVILALVILALTIIQAVCSLVSL